MSRHRSNPLDKIVGSCTYLIHFEKPLHDHAQHYLGWTRNLAARFYYHQVGGAAKLTDAVQRAGIGMQVVRIWYGGRDVERMLKSKYKNSPQLCPICNPRAATHMPLSGIGQMLVKQA